MRALVPVVVVIVLTLSMALIVVSVKLRNLRRSVAGLDDWRLDLSRAERESYAHELRERERAQYELQHQEELQRIITWIPEKGKQ